MCKDKNVKKKGRRDIANRGGGGKKNYRICLNGVTWKKISKSFIQYADASLYSEPSMVKKSSSFH